MLDDWSYATGKTRLQEAQARIANNDADVAHVFTQVFTQGAVNTTQPADADVLSPLAGALVSVKDLFDVTGYITRAGTRFMQDDAAADADAPAIQCLRDAGALLVGHTNMTELAYSGVGLNPHYGTPSNALMPECIPGGSTAGGAVSVALGLADIAIGTDTGGSLRIPAAFNGIVGFKPSQSSVSRGGCKTLSCSLDSIGPMAGSVTACKLAYDIMRQTQPVLQTSTDPVFVIPTNYGMDDLDDAVAHGFDLAVQALTRAGFKIETRSVPLLDSLESLAIWQFAAVEARAEYDEAFTASAELFDPRVASRLARADEVDAISYRKTLNTRNELARRYAQQMRDTVLLMPTVPILPPKFSDFTDDDAYTRLNLQVLRNPSIANVMDGCSVSLPILVDSQPVGIMLSAPNNCDDSLLSLALRCEEAIR